MKNFKFLMRLCAATLLFLLAVPVKVQAASLSVTNMTDGKLLWASESEDLLICFDAAISEILSINYEISGGDISPQLNADGYSISEDRTSITIHNDALTEAYKNNNIDIRIIYEGDHMMRIPVMPCYKYTFKTFVEGTEPDPIYVEKTASYPFSVTLPKITQEMVGSSYLLKTDEDDLDWWSDDIDSFNGNPAIPAGSTIKIYDKSDLTFTIPSWDVSPKLAPSDSPYQNENDNPNMKENYFTISTLDTEPLTIPFIEPVVPDTLYVSDGHCGIEDFPAEEIQYSKDYKQITLPIETLVSTGYELLAILIEDKNEVQNGTYILILNMTSSFSTMDEEAADASLTLNVARGDFYFNYMLSNDHSIKVLADGIEIPADQLEITEGDDSISATIAEDYLNTLSGGDHYITIRFSITSEDYDEDDNPFVVHAAINGRAPLHVTPKPAPSPTPSATPTPTATPSVELPVIKSGADQSWTAGNTALTISSTTDYAAGMFKCVKVDGNVLDTKYYDVKAGSTVVTLHADYLKTLSVGKHTLAIVDINGNEAVTTFTIAAKQVTNNANTSYKLVNTGVQ